jgi:hypothetical protein
MRLSPSPAAGRNSGRALLGQMALPVARSRLRQMKKVSPALEELVTR